MIRGLAICMLSLAAGGCGGAIADMSRYMTPERKDKGLVVILPGIEGISPYNLNIQDGLIKAKVDCAIAIYPWGRPIPLLGPIINQMDVLGNRLAASQLADWLVAYQKAYPGRPVWIVGHSGGGGVAVFAAEALPEGRKIQGLVLLSASIYHEYDLTKALGHLERGVINFYNPDDSMLLKIGTTLTSNVDGARGASAGLNGFSTSPEGLRQIRVHASSNPHGADTRPSFVAGQVAPFILVTLSTRVAAH